MWGSLSAISEAAQQRLQAELKDFQTEAARAEQWRKECAAKKATEPQIQDADRLIPLPNASAFKTALSSTVSANEAAESFSKVTAPFMSAVVQVGNVVGQRVAAEWQEFEAEKARAEERKPALAGAPAARPAPKFSFDEEPTDAPDLRTDFDDFDEFDALVSRGLDSGLDSGLIASGVGAWGVGEPSAATAHAPDADFESELLDAGLVGDDWLNAASTAVLAETAAGAAADTDAVVDVSELLPLPPASAPPQSAIAVDQPAFDAPHPKVSKEADAVATPSSKQAATAPVAAASVVHTHVGVSAALPATSAATLPPDASEVSPASADDHKGWEARLASVLARVQALIAQSVHQSGHASGPAGAVSGGVASVGSSSRGVTRDALGSHEHASLPLPGQPGADVASCAPPWASTPAASTGAQSMRDVENEASTLGAETEAAQAIEAGHLSEGQHGEVAGKKDPAIINSSASTNAEVQSELGVSSPEAACAAEVSLSGGATRSPVGVAGHALLTVDAQGHADVRCAAGLDGVDRARPALPAHVRVEKRVLVSIASELSALRSDVLHAIGEAETAAVERQREGEAAKLNSASAVLQRTRRGAAEHVREARRHAARFKERAEAAEAEVVQKMQLVSQLVEAEEEARGRQLHLQSQLSALGDETTARIAQLEAAAAALSSELEAEREGRRADARTLAHARAETVALERATREREEAAQRDASLSSKDNEYIRTLVMRYIEREADHAALFPPIAAYFKFTRDEVARIRDAQQAHADANSFWGRTISAGSFLVEVATEAAKEVQRHRDQNHSAGAVSGGSGRPRVP
mmetsp:Transcript_25933/g.54368  ORF Transcript_25933/g.54368 Transcript_25933/m.54368 type:complete len:816 (-) Transcript_25933:369-2816(-)